MKQSIDKADLLECVYEVNPGKITTLPNNKDITPSNRILPEEHKQFDPKNLKVTAGFQKHVAKHLSAILDKTTVFKEVATHKSKKKRKKKLPSEVGVLLLNNSKVFLNEEVLDEPSFPKKKVKRNGVSYEVLLKRAKDVAVTPEYVLSKEEIKHWAPEDRGKIEIVKLSNK